MTIKPIIDTTKCVHGNKYTISIYIYHNGTKKVIKTCHHVEKVFFEKGKVTKKHPNYETINSYLKSECLRIEKNYLDNPSGTISDFISKEQKIIVKKITLKAFINEYKEFLDSGRAIGKKGQPLSFGYIRKFKNSLRRIEDFFSFDRKYDFTEINQQFYEDFVYWMRFEKNYGDNFIGSVVKDFKKIMKISKKKSLHGNQEYEDFLVLTEEADTIALSEKEIEAMFKLALSPYRAKELHRFYVAYNFLLRFSDSIIIDKKDIIKEGGRYFLNTVPSKTGNRVIIPLLPRTYGLLKKYNFKFPKTTNQESNRTIKKIGELADIKELVTVTTKRKGVVIKEQFPKYELITTHTSRRSMATNLWNNGFDIQEIMLLGGWKSSTMLQKYLKIDKMDNAKKVAKHKFFVQSPTIL